MMSTNETNISPGRDQTPLVSPGNYSPVTVNMKDSLGAIFLGILCGILLVGWIRTEARYRALITQLQSAEENRSLDT
ncbi:MAG TPA: hypothetical protein VK206_15200 [Anaerolineales bacterium]|nr:hypothetical protein [Anaerolineales bacterium]